VSKRLRVRIFSIVLAIAMFISTPALGQGKRTTINESLRRKLSEMLKKDQRYRTEIMKVEKQSLPVDEMQKRVSALWKKQAAADQKKWVY